MNPEIKTMQEKVSTALRDVLGVEVPSVDTDLFESGALDSLLFVNLLLHIENAFGVSVPLEELELEHFRSVRKIADFLLASSGSSMRPVTVPGGERAQTK